MVHINQAIAWSAAVSAVATIATFVTGILFFVRGEPFGRINDTASVVQLFFMLPLTYATYALARRHNMGCAAAIAAAGIASLVGVGGILVGATYQALLVLRVLPYERAGPRSLHAGFAIGLWLLAAGVLALAAAPYPPLPAACAAIAGLGYLLLVLGFRRGGQAHPLFVAGSLLALGGYTVWALWLSYLILAGRLSPLP